MIGGIRETPAPNNKPRRYGQWAGNPSGQAEDPKRCIKSLHDRYHPGGYQCTRARGHGPDGCYCKQHDPAAVAAKNAERKAKEDAKWKAVSDRHTRARVGEAAINALMEIAAGHNDPRALAASILERLPKEDRTLADAHSKNPPEAEHG
jgi:hypothetical protein